MITCKNGIVYKYDLASPQFHTAFEFLKRNDLAELPLGWIELENGVRASVQRYTSFGWDENNFESHEKYFDVQYVVAGREICGVCSREGLTVVVPYEQENDITFYNDPEHYSSIYLNEGDFIILAPEDVHKPRCMAGEKMEIRKIVLKVPVQDVLR